MAGKLPMLAQPRRLVYHGRFPTLAGRCLRSRSAGQIADVGSVTAFFHCFRRRCRVRSRLAAGAGSAAFQRYHHLLL